MSNIRNGANQCRNLNHGRMNVPISFCPDCGQRFKPSNSAPCGSNTMLTIASNDLLSAWIAALSSTSKGRSTPWQKMISLPSMEKSPI